MRTSAFAPIDLSSLAQQAPAVGGYVMQLTEAEFQTVAARSVQHPVIVEFYSPRDPGGADVSAALTELVNAAGGKFLLGRVDVDTDGRIAQAFGVQAVPTVVAIIGGQMAPLFQGTKSREEIAALLDQIAQLAIANGMTGRAQPVAGTPTADDSAAPVGNPRFAKADAALEAGDYAAAVKEFDALLAETPNDPEVIAGRAQSALLERSLGFDRTPSSHVPTPTTRTFQQPSTQPTSRSSPVTTSRPSTGCSASRAWCPRRTGNPSASACSEPVRGGRPHRSAGPQARRRLARSSSDPTQGLVATAGNPTIGWRHPTSMCVMAHERAGQLAQESDLINVDEVIGAYYDKTPDPTNPDQMVVFGTSGHRGSSLDTAFNEHHIAAITQAICEYRLAQGIRGPLFIGKDTHALSLPAWKTALEVLHANGVEVLAERDDEYTPTPAVSRAIIRHNLGDGARADGIVITPSHNPPEDGGFKYNPPHGGPADTDATKVIAARANELLGDFRSIRRTPYERIAGEIVRHDYRTPTALNWPGR